MEKIDKNSNTKTIAQFLLDEGRITFSNNHSSEKYDKAFAIQNIKDLATGKKAKLSYYDKVKAFRDKNNHSGETEVSSYNLPTK